MLELKNIKAGYKNKAIVDNITLTIEKQEFTGLLGLNGTGKTTLLKTISGLLKALSGNVLLDGQDMLVLNEKERAKHISYMPQRHSIIYDTQVIDLVVMGITSYLSIFESPNKDHMKLAYKMLEIIGMQTYSRDNFLSLSEGQKQLVVLAQALMQNAQVMLFDEPDSALDFKNKHMILTSIRNLIKDQNKIGIITLHDPNLALQYCDRIVILSEGSILAEFYTKELRPDFLKDIFSMIYGDISVLNHEGKHVIVR